MWANIADLRKNVSKVSKVSKELANTQAKIDMLCFFSVIEIPGPVCYR